MKFLKICFNTRKSYFHIQSIVNINIVFKLHDWLKSPNEQEIQSNVSLFKLELNLGVLVIILVRMFWVFGIDNTSSRHPDNHKNNSLILNDGPTNVMMIVLVRPKKRLLLMLQKEKWIFFEFALELWSQLLVC